MRRILIKVDLHNESISVSAEGYYGSECLDKCSPLLKLGEIVKQEYTPEMYVTSNECEMNEEQHGNQ